MSGLLDLGRLERILDRSGACERVETLLGSGVRPRQLQVRTLLLGMLLAAVDGRPAQLRRVHHALLALSDTDQRRLGICAHWREGWHRLTYRQIEYTFARVVRALSKPVADGAPSPLLSDMLDGLLEASVQILGEPASSSYTVDWTDLEAWARPPPKDSSRPGHDPEAAWGHRTSTHPAQTEMFYGYYLQAVTIVCDEHAPEVPELVRRIHLASCQHDPPAQIVPALKRMVQASIPVGDLLADPGYSYRKPETWALPLRALGAELVVDLHPNDRGPHGTHHGATCSNGRLYCPATPTTLLGLGPLRPAATPEQTALHDQQSAELARYKLAAITRPDPDGYHRVSCPAAHGTLRCPLRPESLALPNDRPTITSPPEHPPVCCTQKTITVPPTVNAKTAQKHDYPSPQHRVSYHRRTASERTFATLKDPASTTISRGTCRHAGLTANALHTATTVIARNLRITDAYTTRQTDNQRRAASGLPPKTRKRRRTTIQDLVATAHAP